MMMPHRSSFLTESREIGGRLPRPLCIKVASSFHEMLHGASRHKVQGRSPKKRRLTGFQSNPAIGAFGRWVHDAQGFVDAQDVADTFQGVRRELYVWQLLILGQRALRHPTKQLLHLFLGTVPLTADTKESFESHIPFGIFVIEGTTLGLLSILHEIVRYAFVGIEKLTPNRIGWPVIAFYGTPEAFQRRQLVRQRLGQLIGMGGVGVEAVQ